MISNRVTLEVTGKQYGRLSINDLIDHEGAVYSISNKREIKNLDGGVKRYEIIASFVKGGRFV